MNIFKKKQEEGKAFVGFTKPKKFLFFKPKPKPIFSNSGITGSNFPDSLQSQPSGMQPQQASRKPQGGFEKYIENIAVKKMGLETAMRELGMKEDIYQFVRRMFFFAAVITIVTVLLVSLVLITYGYYTDVIFAVLIGIGVFQVLFQRFMRYPIDKTRNAGKEIEKDILFAARDLVVSMRSGMPLYNAMVAVSTGYGAASREFGKVVSRIQLGSSIEAAIDEVSAKSLSSTFKKIMLQAYVSIRAGADIVTSLQSTVEEVTQERVIELRRYGQRLNAVAMFYMLFGIILPSIGIAVITILTTFISIFTVTPTVLAFGAVGIFGLQIIFLTMINSTRPVFMT